jgi:hypothetical protein
MAAIQVNLVAVLVCSFITFFLGALWYSPLLFAKKWVELIGKTSEELKQGTNPMMYVMAFILGFMTNFSLAFVINLSKVTIFYDGALVGAMCWIGFAGATSYTNQVIFVQRPASLWSIDSGYYLVSFLISGSILAVWK